MKYKRKVRPSLVLPPDLIRGFYEQDPSALDEVNKWVDKNGLVILMTLQKALGDEEVWYEDGFIYMGWSKLPLLKELRKWLHDLGGDHLQRAVKEKWTRKKIMCFLMEVEVV
jgi:hypothetical protein